VRRSPGQRTRCHAAPCRRTIRCWPLCSMAPTMVLQRPRAESRSLLPGLRPRGWKRQLLASGVDAAAAAPRMLDRAPLDLRANTLKSNARLHCAALLPVTAETTQSPNALRLPGGTPAETWPELEQGAVRGAGHRQPAGLRGACREAGRSRGRSVRGRLAARPWRWQRRWRTGGCSPAISTARGYRACRSAPRAPERWPKPACSIRAAKTRRWPIGKVSADAVLVDAPCSGTGTWRRGPEARWRLTPQALQRYARTQAAVLRLGAGLVRPGGRLTFVVCSLARCRGHRCGQRVFGRSAGVARRAAGCRRGHTTRTWPACFPLGRCGQTAFSSQRLNVCDIQHDLVEAGRPHRAARPALGVA